MAARAARDLRAPCNGRLAGCPGKQGPPPCLCHCHAFWQAPRNALHAMTLSWRSRRRAARSSDLTTPCGEPDQCAPPQERPSPIKAPKMKIPSNAWGRHCRLPLSCFLAGTGARGAGDDVRVPEVSRNSRVTTGSTGAESLVSFTVEPSIRTEVRTKVPSQGPHWVQVSCKVQLSACSWLLWLATQICC